MNASEEIRLMFLEELANANYAMNRAISLCQNHPLDVLEGIRDQIWAIRQSIDPTLKD